MGHIYDLIEITDNAIVKSHDYLDDQYTFGKTEEDDGKMVMSIHRLMTRKMKKFAPSKSNKLVSVSRLLFVLTSLINL